MLMLRTILVAVREAEDNLIRFYVKKGKKFSDTSYLQSKKMINDIRVILNRIETDLEKVRP